MNVSDLECIKSFEILFDKYQKNVYKAKISDVVQIKGEIFKNSRRLSEFYLSLLIASL